MTTNIAGKSIGSAIKSLLNSEYKFLGGDKVQELFVGDVMKLFKEYNRDAWNLEPGQTMWFAVHVDEKQSYGKTLEKTRITPVILSVVHDEDRKTIATLTEQLKLSQQEVEFMRRKYKLMWNKAIDEHTT